MNQKILIKIRGMSCSHCERSVEKALQSVPGVKTARVSLARNTAEVEYDPGRTDSGKMAQAVRDAGYDVSEDEPSSSPAPARKRFTAIQFVAIAVIAAAAVLIVQNTFGFNFIPVLPEKAGYGLLFVIGLLTSLHCVAMCGGINLSQCLRQTAPAVSVPARSVPDRSVTNGSAPSRFAGLRPSLLYNSGRVVSYTVIGGIVGGIGSVFSFSPAARSVLMTIAGVFLFVMGLNLLDAFAFLKRFSIRLPRALTELPARVGKYGPFAVGLANGLMPCGPLQAMQLYALGTGSVIAGALSMFFFSLGTVPLLFAVGALSTVLSARFTKGMLRAGGALVMVMGFFLVTNAFALAGRPAPAAAGKTPSNIARLDNGVQIVETELKPSSFDPIRVVKGVPVRWIIRVKSENLNGCNNAIVIPQYGIEKALRPGDNVITFTPAEAGTVAYSCWMGMIRSSITVTDGTNAASGAEGPATNIPPQALAGCCGK